ncbi:hypothetical protein [Reichenbachiella sp.]|uniref:hypothetical protein n=1 Tax=Reichenbachiella sp. TaxID=2184521 RepID=UPI003B5CC14B
MAGKTQKQLIEDIHRGLYGDEKNGTLGLIERQKIDEEIRADHELRISNLERFKKGLVWFSGVVATFLTSVLSWEKIVMFLNKN